MHQKSFNRGSKSLYVSQERGAVKRFNKILDQETRRRVWSPCITHKDLHCKCFYSLRKFNKKHCGLPDDSGKIETAGACCTCL